MFLIAMITVVGFGIYLNKVGAKNFRRLMAFELYVDLIVDFILVYMFAQSGTLGGAMIGAVSGLMFNIMLFFMKRMNGWDELVITKCTGCKKNHYRWITHPGVGWWFLVPPFLRPKHVRAAGRATVPAARSGHPCPSIPAQSQPQEIHMSKQYDNSFSGALFSTAEKGILSGPFQFDEKEPAHVAVAQLGKPGTNHPVTIHTRKKDGTPSAKVEGKGEIVPTNSAKGPVGRLVLDTKQYGEVRLCVWKQERDDGGSFYQLKRDQMEPRQVPPL